MRAIKLSILSAMIVTAGFTSVKAQNADEIIQKHIAAIGGADNWNKINSMKKVGSMSIQGMDIGFTLTVVNNKGVRTDINAMGQSGYVIMTPKEGWMYMPFQGVDKVTPIPAEQLKSGAEQMNVKSRMLVDKSEVSKAEFLGKDTLNNAPVYKLKITDKEGNTHTDYFDATTYYIVRTEMTVKAQDAEQELSMVITGVKVKSEIPKVLFFIESAHGIKD